MNTSVDRIVELDTHGLTTYLNCLVVVSGEVFEIRDSNPFTKSKKESRQAMFLLKKVSFCGVDFDHIWIARYRSNEHWKVGDKVRFSGKLRIYKDPRSGIEKFGVQAPIRNVKDYIKSSGTDSE